ncbi:DNA-binding transcriptional regulator of sugar metabolism, DeoR/GlpR family [Saccharopolyspora antimicrobica]|uniref:Lactose phosphotransferase system repressor n=1 Tax=Saccharopolyspora antimicrobica TaxID=455193 RepID=A0A1I4ZSY9_9PSEU|nr:DeoR/GlpR family DNA-binding transcription regulator [Saccharopolyspora antimicrobica]RKT83414.1 DeoR family transcriptional regulator [Saccharopolyspora antimicrobica]SFN53342.1 DNA-binding transcriptional regulator of sugar metabolism, DeoR/GlpR family [Saccharopolyspora antimicrobica]
MAGRTRPPDAVVEQRRQDVLRQVIEHGEVRITDLAERFEVSLMTMHRDLDALVDRRLVRKLRGRVTAYPSLTLETATRFRVGLQVAEKEALADAAAVEVQPGMTLLVDDSSTVFPLARRIAEVAALRVFTNSLTVAQILAGAGHEVGLLGGRYRAEFDSCTGPEVLKALDGLHADVSFVSAAAVTEGHLFHPVRDYAEIKQRIVGRATRNVLLVDHSKFGKSAPFAHGDVGAYDLVVTDAAAPAAELDAIRGLDTAVRVVPIPGLVATTDPDRGTDARS